MESISNYVYELAGRDPLYNPGDLRSDPFAAIHSEEMDEILRIIEGRKNSIDVESKVVDDPKEIPKDNVIPLDDYRQLIL